MSWTVLGDILGATILFAVPLLLVAVGGMYSERSGIINLALEGIMIIGALAGTLMINALSTFNENRQNVGTLLMNVGKAMTPEEMEKFSAIGFNRDYLAGAAANMQRPMSPQAVVLIALACAAAAGVIFSLLLAFASINLKADQTIGGTALNLLAPALSIVITWAVQGQGKSNIIIPPWIRLNAAAFGIQQQQNLVQNLVFKNLFITTPIAIILFAAAVILLYKTRFGLRMRSCGEHPQAADSVGINVYKMRYAGVMISGFLAGVGGLAFAFAAGGAFSSTVAGYGFLALAVMIFGNWKPFNILGASLFFALFMVFGSYAGSLSFIPKIPLNGVDTYFWPALPYIVTMVLLILTSKKSRAPKAEGIPYDKSTR
ncbi:MAG: ABC transporter permease [Clostridiales bacterium]|nr:ABC transporter permease [Clostridiales bacterium]